MAVSQLSGREEGDFQVNLTNCNFDTLVIGHGNTVNNYCRRLEYGEQSTPSRSRGTGLRMTAIQDGGECRGTKRKHSGKQSKIRYPQQKHRPDSRLRSKRGSSESEEEFVRYRSPEIFPVASCDTKQRMSEFCAFLKRLHPLRDSGNWKEFNSVADGIIKVKQGDLGIEILMSIEKSVVVSYQNDLEKAEAMILEVLETLKKSKVEMSNFIVTMAHLHLTGFYRRQSRHGKAKDSIAIAEQSSQTENSRFVKALIFYEMASNLTKYVSSIPLDRSAREEYVEQAKKYMKKCIDLCIELDDDDSVYLKTHHFGLVKLALLDLNCRTKAARSQITCKRSVKEAKGCLKKIEEKYEDEMKEGQRIQFLVAQCDLNYRQKNLQAALKHAHGALELAKNHGFSLEITAIKERLDEISKLITETETLNLEILRHSDEHMESLSSSTASSQRNSPNSSGSDMDDME